MTAKTLDTNRKHSHKVKDHNAQQHARIDNIRAQVKHLNQAMRLLPLSNKLLHGSFDKLN